MTDPDKACQNLIVVKAATLHLTVTMCLNDLLINQINLLPHCAAYLTHSCLKCQKLPTSSDKKHIFENNRGLCQEKLLHNSPQSNIVNRFIPALFLISIIDTDDSFQGVH